MNFGNKYKPIYDEVYYDITSDDYKITWKNNQCLFDITSFECLGYMYNEPKGSGLYYYFFKEFIKKAKPPVIVELGNREGLGVISIYAGLSDPNQNFISVDIKKDLRYVPRKILKDNKVNFFIADCLNPIFHIGLFQNIKIDMLFCDTQHTYRQLKSEWEIYEKYLSDEAIVFVDDVNIDDKKIFFDTIKQDKIIDYNLHASGFGVIFYKRT